MDFEKKCHLAGWLLFIVCAGFFIASSARDGDIIGLTGGILFLLACLVFLAPFVKRGGTSDER